MSPDCLRAGLASILIATAGRVWAATPAGLSVDNVLVVYDGRKPDAVAIAAHYAGTEAVPGAPAKVSGTRPGVHVFDLGAALADVPLPEGTVDYDQFQKLIRGPLLAHLREAKELAGIRVIVLVRGVPHRVCDINAVQNGDQPQLQGAAFQAGNATSASVDSELALLWQDLREGEKNGRGDSHADGMILNPYWRASRPVTAFSNAHQRVPKKFIAISPGQFWRTDAPASDPSVDSSGALTPGDLYLVCRLDGPSVADVIASLDRARNLQVNTEVAAVVLDEADSNGVADKQPNRELDNQGPEFIYGGDDFEQSRDLLLTDGRFRKENIMYDGKGGPDNFCIGPRLDCKGKGKLVGRPVVLLSSAGANASGTHLLTADGRDATSIYPMSFQYAPGAIFTSIESFNGRDFGSTGPLAGQAQASAFIGAGGTFAICNAWEPFSFSLPDNLMIVRNFLLGDLTWAEAAYTAIPCLSWQQVVIGDPLARVVRLSEDLNRDGVVDEKDLALFDQIVANQDAAGKPMDPLIVGRGDVNHDGAINPTDRALIERASRATAFYAGKVAAKRQ